MIIINNSYFYANFTTLKILIIATWMKNNLYLYVCVCVYKYGILVKKIIENT